MLNYLDFSFTRIPHSELFKCTANINNADIQSVYEIALSNDNIHFLGEIFEYMAARIYYQFLLSRRGGQ